MPRSKRINPISTPKKAYACDSCEDSYRTAGELRKHRNRHTRKCVCSCTKGFPNQNELKRHKIKCLGEEPAVYWVCGCGKGKRWPRKDNFRAHLRRIHPHENIPEFIQECERRRRDVVEDSGQNNIAHHDEKASGANNRGSPTNVQSDFENGTQVTGGLHDQPEWLHDESSNDRVKSIKSVIKSAPQQGLQQRPFPRALKKKPFHCKKCEKPFNRQCELKKHMRRHEKLWRCTFGCGQTCGSQYDWRRHEHRKHPSPTVFICQERYKAAKCQEKLYTTEDFEAHWLKFHQKESPESRDWMIFARGTGCLHFWCGFCGMYVQSQPEQDCLKERYHHLGDHFLGRAKPTEFSMFKVEPRQPQVGNNGTVPTSEDSMELDTPPHPATDARRTTESTFLKNDKIERMSVLAKRAITHLERAQTRPYRRAAAQAAAANLRLRKNAKYPKMYAGVKYARKTEGLFTGKLVSEGTIIDIDGQYYIECGVLRKPLPP